MKTAEPKMSSSHAEEKIVLKIREKDKINRIIMYQY